MWEWFVSINDSVSRIKDGVCYLIPPTEYLAWFHLTGNIVHPVEYAMLKDMDEAFTYETNMELQKQRNEREEALKKAAEEARKTRRGK